MATRASADSRVTQPEDKTTSLWDYLKEGIGGIIALGIVIVAGYIILDTYTSARVSHGALTEDQAKAALDAYNRQRDMLTFVAGFLGAVTGYYFGRVPAERQADRAEKSADDAKKSEAETKAGVKAGLQTLQATLSGSSSARGELGAARAAPSTAQLDQAQLDQAQREIDRMLGLVS
jgi:hypothetical protein